MKNIQITLPKTSERTARIQTGGVVIAPNLKKVSERIDSNGNIIDPITKQIIRKSE